MTNKNRSFSIQHSICIQSIRHGLTLAIPYLLLGSSALLLFNLPIPAWREFLQAFLAGDFADVLLLLYQISLGSLALVLCLSISLSFGRLTGSDEYYLYPLIAVLSYLAFCGGITEQDSYIFSAEWVFTAMCTTLLSCVMFQAGSRLARQMEKLHTIGAEYLFNISIQNLLPCVIIIIFFTGFGHLLRTLCGNNNITNFGSYLFLSLFETISGNLFGTLLYVFLVHALWFFGIHGANTLEAVAQNLFEHQVNVNQALISAGQAPVNLFSKSYLDTFVFLGGCGCALSLVIALCLCARKSHNRKLALLALPFTMFNISEIVIFGFPVILNPAMLIPFLLVPIINTLTSTLATASGLVPIISHSVDWTMPVIFSGYYATGSISGSILQLVNVLLGVIVYIPFVRYSERQQTREFSQAVRQIVQEQEAGERIGAVPQFLHHSHPYNYYAQTLAVDLKNAMHRDKVDLFYQPQIAHDNTLHGVEALFRFEHPIVGFVPPPLAISLATEGGFLDELTYVLLRKACHDREVIAKAIGNEFELSFNITPNQLNRVSFREQVLRILAEHLGASSHLVLEVTENAVLDTSAQVNENIQSLRQCGLKFSIDDFGMGHSSMMHLQENNFDEVKLDGSLVTQILTNMRSREIVAGILHMSDTLNYRVVAEFVETKEQRDLLEELGCRIYQGYYFSRPLRLEELIEYVNQS